MQHFFCSSLVLPLHMDQIFDINVTLILEITETTHPLRLATAKTSWEICCIYQWFPILGCSIYIMSFGDTRQSQSATFFNLKGKQGEE